MTRVNTLYSNQTVPYWSCQSVGTWPNHSKTRCSAILSCRYCGTLTSKADIIDHQKMSQRSPIAISHMTRYNGKGQKVNCIAMSNGPLYTDHRSGRILHYMSQMFTQKRTFLVLALQKILGKAKREISNFALFSHQFCSFECH